jgi:CRISPR system Cascade subunit CasA
MNLLEERWIPVRLRDGSRDRVAPHELAGPQVVAFDAERADFNGALAQFVIGLLQTTTPIDSDIAWRGLLKSPPDAQTLQGWFAPHTAAFEFGGAGARFMQDFDLRAADGEPVGIGSLLIDAPGVKTVEDNCDHFSKRDSVLGLCRTCAALALFTLNVNGPARGSGHRTGLRGGGPITTLLLAGSATEDSSSLWHTLWLNVLPAGEFLTGGGSASKSAPHFTFPWLSGIGAIQKPGGQTAAVQVHPAHVFWAMPLRIRLDLESASSGACDLCGRTTDGLIEQYTTRKHGLDYTGPWTHPLTPYSEYEGEMAPIHLQPGGVGYRHWMGWVLGVQGEQKRFQRARALNYFLEKGVERKTGIGLRLWAFGYDMKSMKARCWYEAELPLFRLSECDAAATRAIREDVSTWLAGAEQTCGYLRDAVKDAWFKKGTARGKFSFVDAKFWSKTERDFYDLLRDRIQAARDLTESDAIVQSEVWLKQLKHTALGLFDTELVGAGPIERMHPARVAAAHNQLTANLNGPKLRTALGIPVEAKPIKATKGSKHAAAATNPKEETQ